MTKYYVIGDIHGRMGKLNSVLGQIKEGEDGKIVFLGDYVDRGKQSRKVLTKVFELVEADKAIALLGNHDDMMVKEFMYPKNPDNMWWKDNYLKPTLNSYYTVSGWDKELYAEHVGKLKSLPLTHVTPTFYFSHSGVPENPLWGRPGHQDNSQGVFPLYNIHGHTPVDEPFIGEYRANLDTGAAWKDGKLTCGVWVEGSKELVDMYQSEN